MNRSKYDLGNLLSNFGYFLYIICVLICLIISLTIIICHWKLIFFGILSSVFCLIFGSKCVDFGNDVIDDHLRSTRNGGKQNDRN